MLMCRPSNHLPAKRFGIHRRGRGPGPGARRRAVGPDAVRAERGAQARQSQRASKGPRVPQHPILVLLDVLHQTHGLPQVLRVAPRVRARREVGHLPAPDRVVLAGLGDLHGELDAVDEVSEQRHRLDGFRAVGPRELVVERRREEAVAEGLDDGVDGSRLCTNQSVDRERTDVASMAWRLYGEVSRH